MKTAVRSKQSGIPIACGLALAFMAGVAGAESESADNAYLTDQRGSVVKNDYGLCWQTGTGPAPRSSMACDPAYIPPVPPAQAVEQSPTPAAAVAVFALPPAAAIERVTLDADALFDFDRASLRPAGRAALDDFAARLKDIDPEMITAVGHADRIGSADYNQKLSEQRAHAVKRYLEGIGIQANRMQAEGRGESQPVTAAGACPGARSAAVIACLQPDRRVEIGVVGNRIAR